MLASAEKLARIGAGRATSVRVVADQASAVVVDVAGEHLDLVLSRSPAGWRIDNVAPNLPGVDGAAGAGANGGQGLPQIPGQ